jgi:tRNA (guanine10-N2)-dimethyltransferase
MINLAAVKSGELILDPFCGSGTVLLEALTLGYQARGFDREKNAIDNTNNNLIWYQRNYPLLQAPLVELGRVEKLASRLEENSVAAIVTEPYLGPALKRSLGREALVAIRSELENLYSLALEQFAKVLKRAVG